MIDLDFDDINNDLKELSTKIEEFEDSLFRLDLYAKKIMRDRENSAYKFEVISPN